MSSGCTCLHNRDNATGDYLSCPTHDETDMAFVGSIALLDALHRTYVEHIGITETDGPDGPYLWCACGWRSDDLGGQGARSGNPGESYALHLTNAQHAAAVRVLQPIVRRIHSPKDAA